MASREQASATAGHRQEGFMNQSFAKLVQPRGLRALVCLAVLLLAGLALYAGGRNLWAWRRFLAAQQAMEQRNCDQAWANVMLCLEVWHPSARVQLLAARIARCKGDYDGAERHLKICEELRGPPEDIKLERALLHAQRGDLPGLSVRAPNPSMVEISLSDPPAEMAEVRDYLESCLAEGHPDKPLILEALAAGYVYNERRLSALHCVEQLLQCRPDHVRALLWHGELKEHYGELGVALEDYRQAVQLDPEHLGARLRLAEGLLSFRRPEEALEHFEEACRRQSGNPEALLGLARCRRDLGQAEEAQHLLDDLLAIHPQVVPALVERARLALEAGQLAEAEARLLRAVELAPHNRTVNFLLYQCLERLGKQERARQCLEQAEQITRDLRRREEINRRLAEAPHDPSLRYEMGMLLLRNGEEPRGLIWLKSALREDPKHQPTHQALADYFGRTGQPGLAARHRRLAQQHPDGVSTASPVTPQ
jgi:tetratricopeptide (TPR) repeat protein